MPETLGVSINSFTRIGRSTKSITPAAILESVPCKARPIASPAAANTATRLVIGTPTCESDIKMAMIKIEALASFTNRGLTVASIPSLPTRERPDRTKRFAHLEINQPIKKINKAVINLPIFIATGSKVGKNFVM